MASDAVVVTVYRSPLTCATRIRLLRQMSPGVKVIAVYTGPTERAPSFRRLFQVCDASYVVPTVDTRQNWSGLDQAYARWWLEQGVQLNLRRLLFLDWDALLLEPVDRLLDQLRPGEARFASVFPVRSLRHDHWARDFTALNALAPADPRDPARPLTRAILFVWAVHGHDLARAAEAVMELKGYCEMRLPYALRMAGVDLANLEPHPLPFGSVSGQGWSRAALQSLQADLVQLQLAHPVYLPIRSLDLRVDRWVWLRELPFLKTLSRRLKTSVRRFALRLGLIPPLNP